MALHCFYQDEVEGEQKQQRTDHRNGLLSTHRREVRKDRASELYIGVCGTVENQHDESDRRNFLRAIRRAPRPDGAGIGDVGKSFWEVYVFSRERAGSMRLFLFRNSALPRWDSMVWK